MTCKIKDCCKPIQYVERKLCQMHYFRYMRNGTYDIQPRVPKYRAENPAGYQKLYEPDHVLANSNGYVYEHRYIYFNKCNGDISACEVCGDALTWQACHIDHKDCDVRNNNVSNLRATCRPCNIYRGHKPTSMGTHMLTVDGVTLPASTWARRDGVAVSVTTIIRRKNEGMSDFDAIYAPRKTCQSVATKKYKAKYDEVRGIARYERAFGEFMEGL